MRALLTLATALFILWIFSNSWKPASESAAQSTAVTEKVQDVGQVVAPDSFVATATGEDFYLLEDIIRNLAHVLEFALLGALCVWTWRAYTGKKKLLFIPPAVGVLTAFADELWQLNSPNRAFEMIDILLDVAGVAAGILFAIITLWIGRKIHQAVQKKKTANKEIEV